MGIVSHVRFRFWDAERYTEAQAEEFRHVRLAYQTHLASAFGALPPVLQLRRDANGHEDAHYPAWTPRTAAPLTSPPHTTAGPLQAFSETLAGMLAVYTQRRAGRGYRKGHPNDPVRLWALDFQDKCTWLATAPSNQDTLDRVLALKRYLETLQSRSVFSHEPNGQGSMAVLLHNLLATLALLEDRLHYDIALSGAREHLSHLKSGVAQVLQDTTQCLFYALADKPRQGLRYSLLAAQAELVDEALETALHTREGALFKNLIHHPDVVRTVLPQDNERKQSTSPAVSLLGGELPTPFLDEKGQMESRWLDFLRRTKSGEAQLDPKLKPLAPGVCPLLLGSESTEEKDSPEQDPLAQSVVLHGLLVTLARYHAYLQHCWQLAGFGGDGLLYDQLAEALVSILTELQTFNAALQDHLKNFQKRLDNAHQQAVKTDTHTAWQQNYLEARHYQQQAIAELARCERALQSVVTYAKDAGARQKRSALAAEAQQRLQEAALFLNQARGQVGLKPQDNYPGLVGEPVRTSIPKADTAGFLTEFDPLLLALVPQQTTQVARLGQLCRETPRREPWSIFWGSRQRYDYLDKGERLADIAQGFMILRLSPQLSAAERNEHIRDLRRRINDEQKLIERLKGKLWPFVHSASLQFFADWESVLHNASAQLGLWEKNQDNMQGMGVQVLLPLDQDSSLQSMLTVKSPFLSDALPAAALLPPTPEPLSSQGEETLATIQQQYQSCSFPQQKIDFETWQQTRFGKLLWNTKGHLSSDLKLTETDVSDIVDAWAEQQMKQSDNVVKQSAEVLVKDAEASRRFEETMRRADAVRAASETPTPLEEVEDKLTYPSLDS